MTRPDYARYGRKQLWSATEASCLLADIEPLPFDPFMKRYNAADLGNTGEIDDRLRQAFDIYGDMKASFDLKNLKFTEARPDALGRILYGRRLVRPTDCIEWARRRRWPAPAELVAVVQELHGSSDIGSDPSLDETEVTSGDQPWVERARQLFDEMSQNSYLSKTRLANKIAAKLEAEGVTGRGNKPVAGPTVLRHAIQNIPRR